MSDIQTRVAEINRRAAVVLEENSRLHTALGNAVTLVLTMAAFGVLTFLSAGQYEQQLKTSALIDQEQITWQK